MLIIPDVNKYNVIQGQANWAKMISLEGQA
jgi:hypothetical protein